jgi:hypothetical protein
MWGTGGHQIRGRAIDLPRSYRHLAFLDARDGRLLVRRIVNDATGFAGVRAKRSGSYDQRPLGVLARKL